MNQSVSDIQQDAAAEVGVTTYVTAQQCSFYLSEQGFLGCTLHGETIENIVLSRALPFTSPDEFLCILKDEKELAMVRRLSDFSANQQEIVRKQLAFRYFTPVVTRIRDIEENVSFLFMKVETNAGYKEICVTDIAKNFTVVDGDRLYITDVEENRFVVDSMKGLDKQSRLKLEIFV